MKSHDGVIVLGAQVGIREWQMVPALHTEMRARAAGIAYQQKITQSFIVSGGYNVGVRYDLDILMPVFGTQDSNKKPDFSDEARVRARWYRSESSVVAEAMRLNYGVPPEALILEEDSKTTKENAKNCRSIIERCGLKKVGLLTLLYHMERALKDFQEIGIDISPLFAEDLLILESKDWISRITDYYSVPKGGKQWDIKRIKELLSDDKSIGTLL